MADSGLKGQTGDWLCWAAGGLLARLQDEPDADQASSLSSLPLRECSSCRRESGRNDFTEQSLRVSYLCQNISGSSQSM